MDLTLSIIEEQEILDGLREELIEESLRSHECMVKLRRLSYQGFEDLKLNCMYLLKKGTIYIQLFVPTLVTLAPCMHKKQKDLILHYRKTHYTQLACVGLTQALYISPISHIYVADVAERIRREIVITLVPKFGENLYF